MHEIRNMCQLKIKSRGTNVGWKDKLFVFHSKKISIFDVVKFKKLRVNVHMHKVNVDVLMN